MAGRELNSAFSASWLGPRTKLLLAPSLFYYAEFLKHEFRAKISLFPFKLLCQAFGYSGEENNKYSSQRGAVPWNVFGVLPFDLLLGIPIVGLYPCNGEISETTPCVCLSVFTEESFKKRNY